MATNSAGPCSLRGPLVPALFLVAPGCRGIVGGTRSEGGSYNRVALGPALCARTTAAAAPPFEADQQVVARRRNLHSSERPLVLIFCSRPCVTRKQPNGCFARHSAIPSI